MADQWNRTQIINHLEAAGFEDLDSIKTQMNTWLERGDGIAVYRNVDFESSQMGHCQYISFGSPSAQIEEPAPPTRLPDIGNQINWRYALFGFYRGEPL